MYGPGLPRPRVPKILVDAAVEGRPLPDAKAKLREVVDALMKGFGRIDPPLGNVQRLIRGKVNLPANGGTDTPRAATVWEPQDNGQMRVRHGDSGAREG